MLINFRFWPWEYFSSEVPVNSYQPQFKYYTLSTNAVYNACYMSNDFNLRINASFLTTDFWWCQFFLCTWFRERLLLTASISGPSENYLWKFSYIFLVKASFGEINIFENPWKALFFWKIYMQELQSTETSQKFVIASALVSVCWYGRKEVAEYERWM